MAADQGHAGAAEALLAHGGVANSRDAKGLTLLNAAAVKDRASVVKVLLAHGADVNASTTGG
jgi:ankyrin repeat protein